MRELKFRAFRIDYHLSDGDNEVYQMVYSDEYKNLLFYVTENGLSNEHMQYTGLKDKNGKEIYEGDIVHIYKEGWDMFPTLELIGKVIYENEFASFFVTGKHDDLISFMDVEDSENIEVIGNIHEKPELLENNQ